MCNKTGTFVQQGWDICATPKMPINRYTIAFISIFEKALNIINIIMITVRLHFICLPDYLLDAKEKQDK